MGCACKKKLNKEYTDSDTEERTGRAVSILLNTLLYASVFVLTVVLMPFLVIGLFISFAFKKPFNPDIFGTLKKGGLNV